MDLGAKPKRYSESYNYALRRAVTRVAHIGLSYLIEYLTSPFAFLRHPSPCRPRRLTPLYVAMRVCLLQRVIFFTLAVGVWADCYSRDGAYASVLPEPKESCHHRPFCLLLTCASHRRDFPI